MGRLAWLGTWLQSWVPVFFKKPQTLTLNKIGAAEGEKSKIFLLTYLLTYSMEQSPPEKLTGSHLINKFSPFYGT